MAEPTFDRPLRADAAVHALGLLLGIVGAVTMVIVAAQSPGQGRMAAVLVFVAGLLAMLGCSAAYNLRITSPRREWLRRLDHAAIFVMIAGTYTPLTLLKLREPWSSGLTAVMWSMAALGIAAKLLQPRRIESLSVVLYLLMGWIGVLAIDELLASVEPTTLLLLSQAAWSIRWARSSICRVGCGISGRCGTRRCCSRLLSTMWRSCCC